MRLSVLDGGEAQRRVPIASLALLFLYGTRDNEAAPSPLTVMYLVAIIEVVEKGGE